MSCVAIIIAM